MVASGTTLWTLATAPARTQNRADSYRGTGPTQKILSGSVHSTEDSEGTAQALLRSAARLRLLGILQQATDARGRFATGARTQCVSVLASTGSAWIPSRVWQYLSGNGTAEQVM